MSPTRIQVLTQAIFFFLLFLGCFGLEEKKTILLMSLPFKGDFLPIFRIAEGLAERQHKVVCEPRFWFQLFGEHKLLTYLFEKGGGRRNEIFGFVNS